MSESVLNHKRILAVDDEPDVLEMVKEEIVAAAPKSRVDTATTYEGAWELLSSWSYDLVILDIMGVRGFDLLKQAAAGPNPIPTVMLTAQAFSPEALKKSIELGARAYLPKQRLGALVPFLEDVLTYEYGPAWKRLLKEVEGVFAKGWGPYWRKPDSAFWDEFEKKYLRGLAALWRPDMPSSSFHGGPVLGQQSQYRRGQLRRRGCRRRGSGRFGRAGERHAHIHVTFIVKYHEVLFVDAEI